MDVNQHVAVHMQCLRIELTFSSLSAETKGVRWSEATESALLSPILLRMTHLKCISIRNASWTSALLSELRRIIPTVNKKS